MIRSAYVHIPFCAGICSYCAFARTADASFLELWLKRISSEIEKGLLEEARRDPDFYLGTLYFGGGTPSLLSVSQFERLASLFTPWLRKPENQKETNSVSEKDLETSYEWTLEANPESMTREKLVAWKKAGVNRLSIGIQSFHDESLKRMNRRHTAKEAGEAIALARECGFENISADLIFALPWMTMEDLKEDLNAFLELKLPHLSIYSLQIEENSAFGKRGLQPVDEDLEADEYELICEVLKKNGYRHYEVSSFCRNDARSRHNLAYWQDENYFGFGYGATGRDDQGLYHFEGTLNDYLSGQGKTVHEEDEDRAFEAIMMALRTDEGLSVSSWNRRYKRDFLKEYESVLERYKDQLVLKEDRICCTEQGMEILNTILVAFLDVQ